VGLGLSTVWNRVEVTTVVVLGATVCVIVLVIVEIVVASLWGLR
jgi:hypothetical protein